MEKAFAQFAGAFAENKSTANAAANNVQLKRGSGIFTAQVIIFFLFMLFYIY